MHSSIHSPYYLTRELVLTLDVGELVGACVVATWWRRRIDGGPRAVVGVGGGFGGPQEAAD